MAQKDPTLKRSSRLIVLFSKEELSLIDDYRFHARAPSRAAAIRDLLRKGIAVRAGTDR
jgi:hypothetical protein